MNTLQNLFTNINVYGSLQTNNNKLIKIYTPHKIIDTINIGVYETNCTDCNKYFK